MQGAGAGQDLQRGYATAQVSEDHIRCRLSQV